jgi:hypothetical protein
MDYEIFSYNNIRHILYISYHGIICSRCNARVLTQWMFEGYNHHQRMGHQYHLEPITVSDSQPLLGNRN